MKTVLNKSAIDKDSNHLSLAMGDKVRLVHAKLKGRSAVRQGPDTCSTGNVTKDLLVKFTMSRLDTV